MLGVLLAGARPGQARPSVADTFDLLRGAVRVRLRRAVSAPDASGWPAATAVAGFLATLLLVADGLRFAVDAPHAISRFADARAHTPFSLPHLLALYFAAHPLWPRVRTPPPTSCSPSTGRRRRCGARPIPPSWRAPPCRSRSWPPH